MRRKMQNSERQTAKLGAEEGSRSSQVYDRHRRNCAQGPGLVVPRSQTRGPTRTPALVRPTDSRARFQTAAPGKRSADWKFHDDRHYPRARAATHQQSPRRLPKRPDSTNSTSNGGPNSCPAASSQQAVGAHRHGTDAPDWAALREFEGRDGPRGGGQKGVPQSQPLDSAPRPPQPRPSGSARQSSDPPIPPSRIQGEHQGEPTPPARALTHLSASPCRRARRCRVPLCTLRTQTNPPPAPAPPPASP